MEMVLSFLPGRSGSIDPLYMILVPELLPIQTS